MLKKRKKYIPFLIVSILFFAVLGWIIIFQSPNESLNLLGVSIPMEIIFFVLILISISLFFSFLFGNILRGVLVGIIAMLILLLRILGFTSILYPLLLLILGILIDRLIAKRA